MKTIWTYKINPDDLVTIIKLPKGYKILGLMTDQRYPFLSILVDTDKKHEIRKRFYSYKTGEPILVVDMKVLNFIGSYYWNLSEHHLFEDKHGSKVTKK